MRWFAIGIVVVAAFAVFGCAGAGSTTTTMAQARAPASTTAAPTTTASTVATTTTTQAPTTTTTAVDQTKIRSLIAVAAEELKIEGDLMNLSTVTQNELESRISAQETAFGILSPSPTDSPDYAVVYAAIDQGLKDLRSALPYRAKFAADTDLDAFHQMVTLGVGVAYRIYGTETEFNRLVVAIGGQPIDFPTTTSTTAGVVTTQAVITTTTQKVATWTDGTYLVGTDIPAGLYKSTAESTTGYWQLSSDPNGDDIIANDNTEGQFYVKLAKGQYLELSDVEIQLASTMPRVKPATADIGAGVYLVGTDIAAGRYKGTVDGDSGYWEITSDANGENILSNDLPEGPFYVQVTKGQYLKLSDVTISLVK